MNDKSKPINLIDSLLDPNESFPPEYLHIFSDITEADLAEVRKAWPDVPVLRKINLLQDLEGMMESDSLLSCDDFARFALTDEDAEVRGHAIKLLWQSEDPKLAAVLGELLTSDPSDDVRVEAAAALGNFVLLGELEEISTRVFERTMALLLQHYNSDLPDRIRQEILRAVSYSSRMRSRI
jgi:HEAT repeat protein